MLVALDLILVAGLGSHAQQVEVHNPVDAERDYPK